MLADFPEKLQASISALPMLYQPIFGYDIVGAKPIRNCMDRLADVKKIYDALSGELNRPLRVLDLACNTAFFSLHVAKWGGVVTAVDIDARYIRVGEILAEEHPDFRINFVRSDIGIFMSNIKGDEYDLVLCFSCLHWLSMTYGFPMVQTLCRHLSRKVDTGLFEFATEDKHRAHVPANYREFLPEYPFIRVLSYNALEDEPRIKRPLCFASTRYVYFENVGIMKIDEIFHNTLFGKATCLRCGDKFVKIFNLLNQVEYHRSQRELQFLNELGGQHGIPKLYYSCKEEDSSGIRIFVVRDFIDGISLSKKIENGEDFERVDAIKQALEWMIFLEQHGYYCGDCTANNFIYNEDGKLYLVDYEDISRNPVGFWWPYDLRMRFVAFMNSVFEPSANRSIDLLTNLKKHVRPKQYQQILEIRDSENFFVRLYEILFKLEDETQTYTMAEIELLTIKDGLNDLRRQADRYESNFRMLSEWAKIIKDQQRRIEQLEQIVKERLK